MSATILTAALEYAERSGWEIFPAPPGEKKSHKSAEHSNGKKWGMTKDPDEIRRDWSRWSSANVGIPTGKVNGIFVLEADTQKGHGVDGIAGLRQLEERHGKLPQTRMAVSPSGSLHYYFNHPGGDIKIKNSSSELALGVDVRGDGGMVIAPPSMRDDGAYRWLNDAPFADPPQWLLDLVTQKHRNAHASGENSKAPPALVAGALRLIPNDDLDWENWNRIGMAAWSAAGGSEDGYLAFAPWSAKSRKNDADVTRERWDSYLRSPPTEIGFGTLDYLAREVDPNWRDEFDAKAEAELEAANREATFVNEPSTDDVSLADASLEEAPQSETEKVEAEPSTEDQSSHQSKGEQQGSGDGQQQQSQPPPNDPEAIRLDQIRREVTIVRVADVEAKKVEWLWPQRIAVGKLTTIAGMPDVNKSTFTLYLAAQTTTGGPWPCNEGTAPLGSVIILTAEDDIADTVRPRLEVAGADLDRVHVIRAITIQDKGTRGFNLTADIFRLELVIRHIGDVKMVIIDPISAYMGKPGKLDSYRSTDVRATLAPLQELAARWKVAVVAIDHLNKSGGTTALLRVLNSIAFVAAARAVYFIMRDDDDEDRRLLLAAKNNLGKIRTGLAFKVIEKLAPPPVFDAYPAIKWEDGAVNMTADEALAAKHDGRASEKLEQAKALLREMLANGPARQTDVEAKASERQIGAKSLRNAKQALGIVSSRADRAWWWRMPAQEPPM